MNVAIIGAGGISEYHIRGYQSLKDLKVLAICDVNKKRAEEMALRYEIPKVYNQVEELLADDRIDAVSVCVWNAQHAELSIKALNAGKHVLCEKPMARNSMEAAEMVKAEKKSGKLLMIGLVRRFDLKTQAAHSFFQSASLGDLYYIKTGYLRRNGQPGGWFSDKDKSGGGSLIDIGIHSLDLAMYLSDAGPVHSIRASIFSHPDMMKGLKGSLKYESRDESHVSNVDDMVVASLTFKNGLVLNLEASWAQHIEKDFQYMEFYGKKGGLQVDPELKFSGIENDFLVNSSYPLDQEGDLFQNMFNREIAHFRDCVVDGESCRSSSETGLELMTIIDTIYRSAELGKEILL